MILVDTSVWIDHLHRSDDQLVTLLGGGHVATHPMVIAELALGTIGNRADVLGALQQLPKVASASDSELVFFIEARRLWSKGLSVVDTHLLASVVMSPEHLLWTRDKRLADAAAGLGVAAR